MSMNDVSGMKGYLKLAMLPGWLKSLMIFLLASALQTPFMCRGCSPLSSPKVYLFTFLLWVFLWQGNAVLTDFLSAKVSWISFPLRRFFLGLVTTVAYTLAAVVMLIYIFERFLGMNFGDSIRYTVGISVLVTILISLFLHSRAFLFHWQKATLDEERFQRERIAARYERLKTKVNPQLLFKSLNTLEGMVRADKAGAITFIKRLSEVYRYILETRNIEVAPLEDELKFLRSYVFLLKARFGGAMDITVESIESDSTLPPLSLQLILSAVIDNATIDGAHPFDMSIHQHHRAIEVKATLCWQNDHSMQKVSEVLRDIENQYAFLSPGGIKFELKAGMFLCNILMLDEMEGFTLQQGK